MEIVNDRGLNKKLVTREWPISSEGFDFEVFSSIHDTLLFSTSSSVFLEDEDEDFICENEADSDGDEELDVSAEENADWSLLGSKYSDMLDTEILLSTLTSSILDFTDRCQDE
jgi:hypothetical protein